MMFSADLIKLEEISFGLVESNRQSLCCISQCTALKLYYSLLTADSKAVFGSRAVIECRPELRFVWMPPCSGFKQDINAASVLRYCLKHKSC